MTDRYEGQQKPGGDHSFESGGVGAGKHLIHTEQWDLKTRIEELSFTTEVFLFLRMYHSSLWVLAQCNI